MQRGGMYAPAQDVTVSVSDGQFTGAFNVGNTVNTSANDKLSITGGTFSSDPSKYVAEGYIARENNGKYVVSMVGTVENPYTLNEFNALTKLPEGRDKLYVDIGDTSVTGFGKCATVGNYKLSDQYIGVNDGEAAPAGYTATDHKNTQNNTTAYRTNKDGITLYVLGTLTMENYNNNNFSGFQTLCFQLPEKSTVILKGMTLRGSFNISGSYTYMYNLSDGSIGHLQNPVPEGYTNVWYGFPFVNENIKLIDCTINGQWFANGNVAKNVKIKDCTFNDYQNATANWGNPIWWKNASTTNLTITECNIASTRPMKVGEGGIGSVNITDNIFTMLAGDKYTNDTTDAVKNTALSFGNNIKGNVVVSGNTVNADATALISLLDDSMTMPEGKTFTVTGNILAEGVKTIVKWRFDTELTGLSFVVTE